MTDQRDLPMPPDPNPGLQMVDMVHIFNGDGTLTALGAGVIQYTPRTSPDPDWPIDFTAGLGRFSTEIPLSDVSPELLDLLFNDGEGDEP